ncbi:MAG: 16S rRNA (guanine(966)-N(2))-methyltransferase RsmD [Oscillospiraceae bacterium]|nr:16S rRNA (guanine(966)-N(2))-methyltransferase RsmD [Oscillospiraceae bacterium]
MKVISGTARGKNLATLDGLATRPTIARVKEAIFSAVQFLVPGANVLDLFAGSGQMGIEALSRGALKCTFVDESKEAIAVVNENLKDTGLVKNAKVITTSADTALSFLLGSKEKFQVVFLDPPYNKGTLQNVLPRVAQVCAPNGVVFCESEIEIDLPQQVENLTKVKQYKYGKVLVTKYQYLTQGEEE